LLRKKTGKISCRQFACVVLRGGWSMVL